MSDDEHDTNPYQSPGEVASSPADANPVVRSRYPWRIIPVAILWLLGIAKLLFLLVRLTTTILGMDGDVTENDVVLVIVPACLIIALSAMATFFAARAWWRGRWLLGWLVLASLAAFWTFFWLVALGIID